MEGIRFTLNIESTGVVTLTIRTDDEEELEQLLERWESRIVVFTETNGKEHNGAREEIRFYGGDTCPECSNKLVKRKGRNGSFIGCKNYPDCRFTAKA